MSIEISQQNFLILLFVRYSKIRADRRDDSCSEIFPQVFIVMNAEEQLKVQVKVEIRKKAQSTNQIYLEGIFIARKIKKKEYKNFTSMLRLQISLRTVQNYRKRSNYFVFN